MNCYQLDCKMRGVCQDTGPYGRSCKRYGPRHDQMNLVGPPTPPVPQRSSFQHHIWTGIHRRNWVHAVVWDGERILALATANTHLSYREVGHLAGLPDHPWLGDAVRSGLRTYCNHAGKVFPLRHPSRRGTPRARAGTPPAPAPVADTGLDLTVTGREPL